jgi:hypothetical protein
MLNSGLEAKECFGSRGTVAALELGSPSAKRVIFGVGSQNNNSAVHCRDNEVELACDRCEAKKRRGTWRIAPLPSTSSIRTCAKECSPMSYLHEK